MRIIITLVAVALFLNVFSISALADDCIRVKPSVSVSPSSVSGPISTTFAFTVTISNQDSLQCAGTKFNITTSLPKDWTSFVRPSSITIFPTKSEIVTVDVASPVSAVKGDNQIILIVNSSAHDTPALKSFSTIIINIREEPQACSVNIDDLILRKSGTDIEKIDFCLRESIDVDSKISVGGNDANVFVDLFVNDKLTDSSQVGVKAGSTATINFKTPISTGTYGKSTPTVKIVAKAACDSTDNTRTKQFEIKLCDPSCLFTTTQAVPTERPANSDIAINIFTKNLGNQENLAFYEASICKDKVCVPMICELQSFRLQADESKTFTCTSKVKETGIHYAETRIVACNKEEKISTSFFGVSELGKREEPSTVTIPECAVEPKLQYRCTGSIRQQLYQNSDCSTSWVYLEYCPFGCSDNKCISSPEEIAGVEPDVTLDEIYEGKACGDSAYTLEIKNTVNSPAKFDISVVGDAAEWMHVPKSIIIGENAKEDIKFYASVPCDAEEGKHEFSLTVASGARAASKSSAIEVIGKPPAAAPEISPWTVGIIIGGLIAAYVILRHLQAISKREAI